MTISNDLPLPPGSFGLPLLGETIAFLTDGDFASKRHNKYGQLFRTHIFGSPTIIL
ncbi:MAG: cytochrome P450, partial [Microcystis sp.]